MPFSVSYVYIGVLLVRSLNNEMLLMCCRVGQPFSMLRCSSAFLMVNRVKIVIFEFRAHNSDRWRQCTVAERNKGAGRSKPLLYELGPILFLDWSEYCKLEGYRRAPERQKKNPIDYPCWYIYIHIYAHL